jgi:hypothetical protein
MSDGKVKSPGAATRGPKFLATSVAANPKLPPARSPPSQFGTGTKTARSASPGPAAAKPATAKSVERPPKTVSKPRSPVRAAPLATATTAEFGSVNPDKLVAMQLAQSHYANESKAAAASHSAHEAVAQHGLKAPAPVIRDVRLREKHNFGPALLDLKTPPVTNDLDRLVLTALNAGTVDPAYATRSPYHRGHLQRPPASPPRDSRHVKSVYVANHVDNIDRTSPRRFADILVRYTS